MPHIRLMVGTNAPTSKIISALTTIEGLSKWWTSHTTESTDTNEIIQFRFPENGPDMRVIESTGSRVVWECINGVEEWVGTQIQFNIEEKDEQTFIMFKHANWAEETPFMYHCSTKWAVFLLSLKSYLETGKGQPFPHDIQITHN